MSISRLPGIVGLALSILVPQGLAQAGAIGKEGVQALYEKVESILDNPTPEDPFYLKSENKTSC